MNAGRLAVLAIAVLLAPAGASGQAAFGVGAPSAPNAADARFVTDMIPHHAQAVKMAGWAESHGASPALQRFAKRILVAQRDEISMMRSWLLKHDLPVPDSTATHKADAHSGHGGHGNQDEKPMYGMLSDEEMAKLDAARGVEFDRLFLTYMIRHHQGAVGMVDELFKSYGAAQDEFVFRFASDVYADQTTEIDFLLVLLDSLPPPGRR